MAYIVPVQLKERNNWNIYHAWEIENGKTNSVVDKILKRQAIYVYCEMAARSRSVYTSSAIQTA